MKNLFNSKKFERPVIFNNDQQAIIIKEYKIKIKTLISINEDTKNELKRTLDSLTNFKTYLSEIGLIQKSNILNTSRNFNIKIINLIQKDNQKYSILAESIQSAILSYSNQVIHNFHIV